MQPADDPVALLNDEVGKTDQRLEVLKKAIEDKQARLGQIEQELNKIRIIGDILHLEEKQKIIEQIQRSPEYEELEACRDQAA